MPDRSLSCSDCKADFTFSEAEQRFFQERGFTNDPKRCPGCRKKRREKTRGGRPPRARPGGAPAGRPPAARRASAPAESERAEVRDRPLQDAVCSLCGDATQVPFKPDGVRPVFCLPCLKKQTR